MTNVPPPLVGAETWKPVIDKADARCQCTGQCGKRHLTPKRVPGRCEEIHQDRESRRLLVAPEEHSETFPPPSVPLMAWCRSCFDGRRRTARRVAKQAPPQEFGLFDTDDLTAEAADDLPPF